MSDVAKTPDARRLATIRSRLRNASIPPGGDGWSVGYAGTDRVIVDGISGEVLFTASTRATIDEFDLAAGAPGDLAFLLDLVDRAASRVRALQEAGMEKVRHADGAGKDKDYAAEAAMKCQTLPFRLFLRHHPDAQPVGGASADRDPVEIAADRLRAILRITSRAELNRDQDAAARWIALRAEFGQFQTMPETVRAARYPGYGEAML